MNCSTTIKKQQQQFKSIFDCKKFFIFVKLSYIFEFLYNLKNNPQNEKFKTFSFH